MKKLLLVIVIFFSTDVHPLMGQITGSLGDLWKPLEGERNRVSSYNTDGLNKDFFVIKSGQSQTLSDITHTSGCIQRIWFTISSEDSLYLQNIRIGMTFDDNTTVNYIPVGMFSGTGPWRVNDLNTPVLNIMRSRQFNEDQNGVGAGSFNIHWTMPFTSNVKIEMYNGSAMEIKLFYYIDYVEMNHQTKPLLFHANYHIQSPTKPANHEKTLDVDKNYKFLNIKGYRGRYVGTILCVESHPDREGKWYEGDDMFVIDGEPWPPRLHGTGTEDYFGMAWGYHRSYQAFDHGITHFEKNITDHDRFYDGRYVTYRFHVNDPIIFYKSIDASIESGRRNECVQHYESLAIWYGLKNE